MGERKYGAYYRGRIQLDCYQIPLLPRLRKYEAENLQISAGQLTFVNLPCRQMKLCLEGKRWQRNMVVDLQAKGWKTS
jgi:hypothetical protein